MELPHSKMDPKSLQMFIRSPHRILPCETEHEQLIATVELWSCHTAKWIQNPYKCSSETRTASPPVKQNTIDCHG
jgi:hypothetical protein